MMHFLQVSHGNVMSMPMGTRKFRLGASAVAVAVAAGVAAGAASDSNVKTVDDLSNLKAVSALRMDTKNVLLSLKRRSSHQSRPDSITIKPLKLTKYRSTPNNIRNQIILGSQQTMIIKEEKDNYALTQDDDETEKDNPVIYNKNAGGQTQNTIISDFQSGNTMNFKPLQQDDIIKEEKEENTIDFVPRSFGYNKSMATLNFLRAPKKDNNHNPMSGGQTQNTVTTQISDVQPEQQMQRPLKKQKGNHNYLNYSQQPMQPQYNTNYFQPQYSNDYYQQMPQPMHKQMSMQSIFANMQKMMERKEHNSLLDWKENWEENHLVSSSAGSEEAIAECRKKTKARYPSSLGRNGCVSKKTLLAVTSREGATKVLKMLQQWEDGVGYWGGLEKEQAFSQEGLRLKLSLFVQLPAKSQVICDSRFESRDENNNDHYAVTCELDKFSTVCIRLSGLGNGLHSQSKCPGYQLSQDNTDGHGLTYRTGIVDGKMPKKSDNGALYEAYDGLSYVVHKSEDKQHSSLWLSWQEY